MQPNRITASFEDIKLADILPFNEFRNRHHTLALAFRAIHESKFENVPVNIVDCNDDYYYSFKPLYPCDSGINFVMALQFFYLMSHALWRVSYAVRRRLSNVFGVSGKKNFRIYSEIAAYFETGFVIEFLANVSNHLHMYYVTLSETDVIDNLEKLKLDIFDLQYSVAEFGKGYREKKEVDSAYESLFIAYDNLLSEIWNIWKFVNSRT